MTIEIGQTLSHYRVVEKIGAGGMGEVYRAQDSNLGRDVALKILPPALADDADRVARFQREARTLASVQHANIATIHGFEEDAGVRFLVMEFAEGEDLSRRLERGPIALDEALEIARQVAKGLQAAHDVGIVHRDLKPANVLLSPDGEVKLLDFGLARAFVDDDTEQDIHGSPTIPEHMTQAGMILGTAGYMSPEQARGKRVDRRTDIWALGCVLFEMLSARQAFPGETVSDIIAKVIQTEPPWEVLPQPLPPAVHRLLRRCLRKDADRRLHDVADVRVEIEEILAGTEELPADARTPTRRPRRVATLLPWIVAGMLLATFVAALVLRPVSERSVVQFDVFAPPGHSLREFAVAPDGSVLAFVAYDRQGAQRLWVRELQTTEMRPLSGTEDAAFPFWSPDSRSIGFFASGKLRRIDVATETIQTLTDAPNGRGADWSPDDLIVFTPEGRSGLYQIDASGGEATAVTELMEDEESHRFPRFLPDGRRFAFLVQERGGRSGELVVASLDSGERTSLLEGASEVQVVGDHLLHLREAALVAEPLDTKSLARSGKASLVAKGVADGIPVYGRAGFSVSRDFVLAYYRQTRSNSDLVWIDRAGRRVEKVSPPEFQTDGLSTPELSVAGDRVAYARAEAAAPGEVAVWVLDLARGAATQITPLSNMINWGVWSADDSQLFISAGWTLYRQPVGGGASVDTVWVAPPSKVGDFTLPSWAGWFDVAHEDAFLAFSGWNSQTDQDIWRLDLDDERMLQPLVVESGRQIAPRISPDGRWVAYESDETGRAEVWVVSATGSRAARLISTGGGSRPHWKDDGSELYYIAPDRQLMAVAVEAGPTFQASLPEALFPAPGGPTDDLMPQLVAARDGRFLFNARVAGAKPPAITVMLNWDRALTR